MKKLLAIILVSIMVLFAFTACGVNVDENYDTLVNHVIENGTKNDNTYSITYMRMDLGSVWDEDDGSVTIKVDGSGNLIFESFYSDHTTSMKYVKGQDLCEVEDIYYQTSGTVISTGEISMKSFSAANKTVESFKSNSYADYKELLGGNANLLILGVKLVLEKINVGITVSDIGFKNYDY